MFIIESLCAKIKNDFMMKFVEVNRLIKAKSALLYIFITICVLMLFASFDAESYFDYASALNVSDEIMLRALKDDMSGLYIPTEEEEEPTSTSVTEYVLNDESEVIKQYKFTLYYLDYCEYPEDGRFDAAMQTALRKYQTEKLITVSGILDEETMNVLDSEVLTYKEGKYGDAIMEYKKTLRSLGYYESDSVITDAFDSELTEIVKKYQKNNSLEETGILDIETQIMLRKPVENQADSDGNVKTPIDTTYVTDTTKDDDKKE